MPDANIDYSYNEYTNLNNEEDSIKVEVNGEVLEFDIPKVTTIIESSTPPITETNHVSDTKYGVKLQEDFDEKKEYEEPTKEERYLNRFFEQRPDVKIIYDEIENNIANNISTYVKAIDYKIKMEYYLIDNESKELEECLDQLRIIINAIREENILLFEKKSSIKNEAFGYNKVAEKLDALKEKIQFFQCCHPYLEPGMTYEDVLEVLPEDFDEKYLPVYEKGAVLFEELLKEQAEYQEEVLSYISKAITMDDIRDKIKGYNSLIGLVPAGEWDACINPNYDGEGYVTGLAGSYEGPQGKETGYDSRKGDEKLNYKDPDRSLLKLLSLVTDSDGNQLYPMESFEKGGEYYYHIFGVNDDGTINWDLIDNPRFGCKMLGDYLIVGGDQREHRERGSKVMTSIGPAIVFDYGTIDDLYEDPSHIDISMDEVLFWLKDFSHNQNREIESLAGIYDWCTTEDFDGLVDIDYECMERNYVNNINVTYNKNYKCIFDREDFDDTKNYDSQEEFVYSLKY